MADATSQRTRIFAMGECMIEFATAGPAGGWKQGFAGDSYNVATYLQRLCGGVSYLTAVGADPLSDEMVAAFTGEGIDVSGVLRHQDRSPGLYVIRLDDRGERSFQYWRDCSAARAFFTCPGAEQVLQTVEETAALLYVSGITLSLFDEIRRNRLERVAAAVRGQGGLVAFDTNYRPRGWDSPAQAQAACDAFASHASILLPTFEDDALLYGVTTPEAAAQRWLDLGVDEVVVKLGAAGALVASHAGMFTVDQPDPVHPLDTTGAGDSFNAAYLAARLHGNDPRAAAGWGNRLAGRVVQEYGAIIPHEAMPSLR